ncbi:MAG: cysteine desulfurase-like protein [Anaerolineae bacterium]|nr:cysteine desulfurase-like protein [Anaerolineae bacterium]
MTFDVQRIRTQFPSLHHHTDAGSIPIFFDNPAGTQVPKPVMDAVTTYYMTMNANHGGAFATSKRSDAMVHAAREKAAALVNAPRPEEIVFGPNMTTLSFALSRAIGKMLSPGDEIVLTRMDHDANVTPWTRIADDYDLTVRWVDIHIEDCTLDMDTLEAALTDRTKVVATVHASNAAGTINPVQQIAAMAHAAGALYVVDAVQSTPHITIDVQEIGCDFLLCSAYKFFGPHIGILWGKYDLLASLPAYKVRPADDHPPHRWETGTASFETINGVAAAIDYLAWVGDQFGDAAKFPHAHGLRRSLLMSMDAIGTYERTLADHLIAGLQAIKGVTVRGITNPARGHERVPTVIFEMDGFTPLQVAEYLAEQHIYVWDGNYYAVEIMNRLGRGAHGMVRVGPVHYNTIEEIDTLLERVASLAKK